MSGGKPHFLVDRVTRTTQRTSRETAPGGPKKDPISVHSPSGVDSKDRSDVLGKELGGRCVLEPGTLRSELPGPSGTCFFLALADFEIKYRYPGRAPDTNASALGQLPAPGLGFLHTANDNMQTIPKKKPDDDKSVTLDLNDLSLQRRGVASNKRPAFEGQDPQAGGRPTKLRSGSQDNSTGRGSPSYPPRPAHYNTARDPSSGAAAAPLIPAATDQDSPDLQPHPDTYTSTESRPMNTGFIPADRVPHLLTASKAKSSPVADPDAERFASTSPPTSPTLASGPSESMLLQPETRPITQEQLVNEVKGIYAGLVMVEKKCVEVHPFIGPPNFYGAYRHSVYR
jgi:hypothetical protein